MSIIWSNLMTPSGYAHSQWRPKLKMQSGIYQNENILWRHELQNTKYSIPGSMEKVDLRFGVKANLVKLLSGGPMWCCHLVRITFCDAVNLKIQNAIYQGPIVRLTCDLVRRVRVSSSITRPCFMTSTTPIFYDVINLNVWIRNWSSSLAWR